jgi:hypothetical protein
MYSDTPYPGYRRSDPFMLFIPLSYSREMNNMNGLVQNSPEDGGELSVPSQPHKG